MVRRRHFRGHSSFPGLGKWCVKVPASLSRQQTIFTTVPFWPLVVKAIFTQPDCCPLGKDSLLSFTPSQLSPNCRTGWKSGELVPSHPCCAALALTALDARGCKGRGRRRRMVYKTQGITEVLLHATAMATAIGAEGLALGSFFSPSAPISCNQASWRDLLVGCYSRQASCKAAPPFTKHL